MSERGGVEVWLVDDEPAVLMVTRRALQREGFAVREFAAPGPALSALAADGAPSVLVTDQGMPGMSGVELLQAVHASHPDLPVVLLSGFITDEIRASTTATHVRFLQKPPRAGELVEVVRALAGA